MYIRQNVSWYIMVTGTLPYYGTILTTGNDFHSRWECETCWAYEVNSVLSQTPHNATCHTQTMRQKTSCTRRTFYRQRTRVHSSFSRAMLFLLPSNSHYWRGRWAIGERESVPRLLHFMQSPTFSEGFSTNLFTNSYWSTKRMTRTVNLSNILTRACPIREEDREAVEAYFLMQMGWSLFLAISEYESRIQAEQSRWQKMV